VEVYTADPLVTKEVALKALRSMKNDVEQFPERDDILRLMAGFKHALGREADSAYPDFEEWATAHDFKNADEFKHMWDSLRVVHVPADYLFSKARERGFSTAALDFADFKMSEEDFAAGRRQQQEEEDAYQEVANRLLYIAESGTWIVKGTGEMLTHSALNTYPGLGTALAPAGASGQKTAANMLINRGGVGLVRGAVYLAGKGETVKWTKDGRGGEFFNLWHATYHDLPASVTDEQVQPWLEHVAYIIPNQEEREHFLNYLAYIVQNRGVKVRYAPIIVGGQGTGKDLMLRPLSQFFDHNYVEIGPEALADKFNGYLERELVVVNEMMRFDKQSTYDRIKVLISGSSSDSLRVEKKFKDAYDVPNNVNLIFFSNHADAVSLEGDDRRFFVITSDAVRKDDEYYDRLADDFYKYQSGWRAVIRWLMQRDVQEFKPDARPMETDGKREMIDASRPAFLSTIIKELDGFHKQRTVLTSRELFDTVVSDYNYPMPQPMRQKVASVSKVSDALKAAGWANGKKMVRLVAGENPTRVWTRDPEMLNWSDDRLRAQYLTEIKKVA
jgi:hypothetical protein